MDNPAGFAEIGILAYEGSQAAAVLGMTDMLTSAAEISRLRKDVSTGLLGVSHWTRSNVGDDPVRVFSSEPGRRADRCTVAVIPPGLGDPLPEAEARYYLDWLRTEHSRGAVLCSDRL